MALPPPPDGLDLTETQVPQILGTLISTWSLAAIAVGLRIIAHRLKGNSLWLGDYLVFISLIAAGVHVFTSIGYMVPHGTGKHVWTGPPDAVYAWSLGLFVSEVAYTLTLATVKWSTLALYWRIFSANRGIRIPIWVLTGVVGAWAIAVLLISIFQCYPPRAFWERWNPVNPMTPDQFHCGVDTNKFFNGNSIPNIVTDAFIVLLPLPYVWKLQLPMPQRFALVGIFALGTFVTIISIVRLTFILDVNLKDVDVTWNFCKAILWTNVEANIAIVGCCLPTLKPILNLALRGSVDSSARSGGNMASNASTGTKQRLNIKPSATHGSFLTSDTRTNVSKALKSDIDGQHPFARLDDQGSNSSLNGEGGVYDYEMGNMGQSKGIMVTKQLQIQSDIKLETEDESRL